MLETVTVKVTLDPCRTVWLCGWSLIIGGAWARHAIEPAKNMAMLDQRSNKTECRDCTRPLRFVEIRARFSPSPLPSPPGRGRLSRAGSWSQCAPLAASRLCINLRPHEGCG